MSLTIQQVIRVFLILGALVCNQAMAETPGEMLDGYFNYLYTNLKKLDDKSISSRDRIKIQSDLVNGRGHWIMKHGAPGRATNLVGLLYSKKPTAWTITPKLSHEKFALLYVDFSMPEFPGHPWRTELDVIRIGGKWKIRSFTDITRRPLPPGSDIETVLDGYFTAASKAAGSLYSDTLSKKEKQSVNMIYGLGAGSWTGQLRRKDLPAGSMFTYFKSSRPTSWEIEAPKIAGAYAEAKVHFSSKPRYGDPVRKTYTIELNLDRGEWFLVGHRSKLKKSAHVPAPEPAVVIKGDGPEVIAKKQLDLLTKAGVKMQDLVEASKPLWLKNGKARRGMGKLLGMAMGMLGQNKDSTRLDISDTTITGSTAVVTVTPKWPQAISIKPFSRIQLSLINTDAGWRLADAVILLK